MRGRENNENWWEYGGALLTAAAGGLITYTGIKWVVESFTEKDGIFSWIGGIFGSLMAVGFAAFSLPWWMEKGRNTVVPWLSKQIDNVQEWGQDFYKKTIKGQKTSLLGSEAATPETSTLALAQAMPQTSIRLSSVAYGGHVTEEAMGQLSAQATVAQAETASKQQTISA